MYSIIAESAPGVYELVGKPYKNPLTCARAADLYEKDYFEEKVLEAKHFPAFYVGTYGCEANL